VIGASLNDRPVQHLRHGARGHDPRSPGSGEGPSDSQEPVPERTRSPGTRIGRGRSTCAMRTLSTSRPERARLVGLVLLLAALAVPLVAGIIGRRTRFVAPACGAYVAWLAASGLDWHWEMVRTHRDGAPRRSRRARRRRTPAL
jgi:hypothetical protein